MVAILGRSPYRKWEGGCGGGCCNSKAQHRKAKKAAKRAEKAQWKKDAGLK